MGGICVLSGCCCLLLVFQLNGIRVSLPYTSHCCWLCTPQLTMGFARHFAVLLLSGLLSVPATCGGFAVSPWDESFYLVRVTEAEKLR